MQFYQGLNVLANQCTVATGQEGTEPIIGSPGDAGASQDGAGGSALATASGMCHYAAALNQIFRFLAGWAEFPSNQLLKQMFHKTKPGFKIPTAAQRAASF